MLVLHYEAKSLVCWTLYQARMKDGLDASAPNERLLKADAESATISIQTIVDTDCGTISVH